MTLQRSTRGCGHWRPDDTCWRCCRRCHSYWPARGRWMTGGDSQRAHRDARYDARRLSSGIRLHETRNASLGSSRARGHRLRAGDDQRAAHAARALLRFSPDSFRRIIASATTRTALSTPARSRWRRFCTRGECVRARSSDRLSSVTIAGWLRDSTPIQRLRGSVCVTATGGRHIWSLTMRSSGCKSRIGRSSRGFTCTTRMPRTHCRSRIATMYHDAPYLGALAVLDAQVGRVARALETHHVLDRTLLVVASDHGESLGEHGEDSHGILLYQSTLHVPFIMRVPGLAPGRVTDVTRLADVMPTVLDLLHVPAPLDGWREPRSTDDGARETPGSRCVLGIGIPAPVRLERAVRAARRTIQVHRRTPARAVRPRDGPS